MRLLVLLLLAGCVRSYAPQVPVVDAAHPHALAVHEPGLVPGEQMVWDVFWQGVTIGRAELRVDATGASSAFATGMLASAFANVRHTLATSRPHRTAREHVVYDGEVTHHELTIDGARLTVSDRVQTSPGGAPLHTIHSALAAVRGWASPEAPRAFLWLFVDGALYRLDLERPVADRTDLGAALRVEGTVRPLAPGGFGPLEVTAWLARTADRTPVRFVVRAGDHRISAELAESTASL